MSDTIRIVCDKCESEMTFTEGKVSHQEPNFFLENMMGWPKWKVLKHCAEKGWNHAVINKLPESITHMNQIIPKDFAITLDAKRPRIPYQSKDPKEWDLIKILDLLIEGKLPITFNSGLCGVGERLYVHITSLANAKHWNFAFGVRNKAVVNCLACVTPGGKEWSIDQEEVIDIIPREKWQKLTALLIEEGEKKRRILAVPVWKVCIEITPGAGDWVGFGPMYDKSTSPKGLSYPQTLHAGIYFEVQSDAEAAAKKAQAYFDDLCLKESKKKK